MFSVKGFRRVTLWLRGFRDGYGSSHWLEQLTKVASCVAYTRRSLHKAGLHQIQ